MNGQVLFLFHRISTADRLPALLQQSFEDSERNKKTTKEEDEEELPDPVTQLVTMFSRQAQMEQGPQAEDTLYMDYAVIMAK